MQEEKRCIIAFVPSEYTISLQSDMQADQSLHRDVSEKKKCFFFFVFFLTLKVPITTVADDIPKYLFIVFQRK